MIAHDPIENRDGTDSPRCVDCDRDTARPHPVLLGEFQCPSCAERDDEEAYARALNRYYGGGGPVTVDEQHAQAWRAKTEGR